jgi:hypothetical protein
MSEDESKANSASKAKFAPHFSPEELKEAKLTSDLVVVCATALSEAAPYFSSEELGQATRAAATAISAALRDGFTAPLPERVENDSKFQRLFELATHTMSNVPQKEASLLFQIFSVSLFGSAAKPTAQGASHMGDAGKTIAANYLQAIIAELREKEDA